MSQSQLRDRLYRLADRFHHVPTLIRIPLGILLIIASFFFFLPVLGLWMAPLGLLLIAEDFKWAHSAFEWVVDRLERMEAYFLKRSSNENHEND